MSLFAGQLDQRAFNYVAHFIPSVFLQSEQTTGYTDLPIGNGTTHHKHRQNDDEDYNYFSVDFDSNTDSNEAGYL